VKHSTTSRIAALLACLAAPACGGSQTPPASPASEPATQAAPAEQMEDTQMSAPAAGAAPAPPPAAEAPSSTKSARDREPLGEIETWDQQLDGALALSTPSCMTAWSLRDRICDLAQRLCDIASRSAEPEVADRCTDGRARCERATTRVRAVCPE
jgi:hypothetical protein